MADEQRDEHDQWAETYLKSAAAARQRYKDTQRKLQTPFQDRPSISATVTTKGAPVTRKEEPYQKIQAAANAIQKPFPTLPSVTTGQAGMHVGVYSTPVTEGDSKPFGFEDQNATRRAPTLGFSTQLRPRINKPPVAVVDSAPWARGGYNSGSTEGEGDLARLRSHYQQGNISKASFEFQKAQIYLSLDAPRAMGAATSIKASKRMVGVPVSRDPTAAAAGAGVDRGEPATPAFPTKNQYIKDDAEREAYYDTIKAGITAYNQGQQGQLRQATDRMVGRYVPGRQVTEGQDTLTPYFRQAGMAMARNIAESGTSQLGYSSVDLLKVADTFGSKYGIPAEKGAEQIETAAQQLSGGTNLQGLIRMAAENRIPGYEGLRGPGGQITDQATKRFADQLRQRKPVIDRKNGQPVYSDQEYGEDGAKSYLAQHIVTSSLISGDLPKLFKESEFAPQAAQMQATVGARLRSIEDARLEPSGANESERSRLHNAGSDHAGDSSETMGGEEFSEGMGFKTAPQRRKDTDQELKASFSTLQSALEQHSRGLTPVGIASVGVTPWRERSDAFELTRIGQTYTTTELQEQGSIKRRQNALPQDIIGSQQADSALLRTMAEVTEAPDWRMLQKARGAKNPLTGRQARRLSRTIGAYYEEHADRLEAARTSGDVTEEERERTERLDANADPSTANQSFEAGHTLADQYKNMGGFAPDPLAVALRQSATLSGDITLGRREGTLFGGQESRDVDMSALGEMLVSARGIAQYRPTVKASIGVAPTKDISGRNLEFMYEEGSTPAEILRGNADAYSDVFEHPPGPGERTMDDVVFDRIKSIAASGPEDLQKAYGVSSPELARAFHQAGTKANAYASLGEDAPLEQRNDLAQYSSLRGALSTALADQYDTVDVEASRAPRAGRDVRSYRQADIRDLVPQTETWRRDAEQAARAGREFSQFQSMIPEGLRQEQAQLYSQLGADKFADYQQGSMWMAAVQRSSDFSSMKGMLDPMGKDLNIPVAMNSPEDAQAYVRGQANRAAAVIGIGNPVSAASDRAKNTRAFLGRIGLMINSGNVTEEEVAGDRAGQFSNFAGFQDSEMTNSTLDIKTLGQRYQAQADAYKKAYEPMVPVEIATERSGMRTVMQSVSHVRGNLDKEEAEIVQGFQRTIGSDRGQASETEQMYFGFLDKVAKNNFSMSEKEAKQAQSIQGMFGDSLEGALIGGGMQRLQRLGEIRAQREALPSVENYASVMTKRIGQMSQESDEAFLRAKNILGEIPEDREQTQELYRNSTGRIKRAYGDLLRVADIQEAIPQIQENVSASQQVASDYQQKADAAFRLVGGNGQKGLFNDDEYMDSLSRFMTAGMSGIAERVRGIPQENGANTGVYGRTQIRETFGTLLKDSTAEGALGRLQQLTDLHDQFRAGDGVYNEDTARSLASVLGARTDFIAGAFNASSSMAYNAERSDFLYGVGNAREVSNESILDATRQAIGPGVLPGGEKNKVSADQFVRDFRARATDEQTSILDSDPTKLRIIDAGPGAVKTGTAAAMLAQLSTDSSRQALGLTFSRSGEAELRSRLDSSFTEDAAERIHTNTYDAEALKVWRAAQALQQSERERALPGITQYADGDTGVNPLGSSSGQVEKMQELAVATLGSVTQRLNGSEGEYSAKAAAQRFGSGAEFTKNLYAHIDSLANEGHVGGSYLQSIAFKGDDGNWRLQKGKQADLSDLYAGLAMQGLHQEYARTGEGDFTFMKGAATRLLNSSEKLRNTFNVATTVGLVDESNDTKKIEANFAAARFGGGLAVFGDVGQNLGVDFRNTAVNFRKTFEDAWAARGKQVGGTFGLTVSRRQGPAAITAANAILGLNNQGNPDFDASQTGTFAYKNYNHSEGLKDEIAGQVSMFGSMIQKDGQEGPIDLQRHRVGFFTPTNDGRKNIISELKKQHGEGLNIIGADDEWKPGSVIVSTVHGIKGRTLDVGFGIGMGTGKGNLSQQEGDSLAPEAIQGLIQSGNATKEDRAKMQRSFMGNVAATRSNITIMSGSGQISSILRPAVDALRGLRGEDKKRSFSERELLSTRGADTPADPRRIAEINRDKLLLAAQTNQQSALTTAPERILPVDMQLRKGDHKFTEEQARRSLQEMPSDLAALQQRTPLSMKKVQMTLAEYQKYNAGEMSALPRPFTIGSSKNEQKQFEIAITDPGFKGAKNLPTGAVVGFGSTKDQRTFRSIKELGGDIVKTGFGAKELISSWAQQYTSNIFNKNQVPSAFRNQSNTRKGVQPDAMFLNEFERVQQGVDLSGVNPVAPAAQAKGYANIPGIAGDRGITTRDGKKMSGDFLLHGADESSPWSSTLRSAPRTRLIKETAGQVQTFSDREQYEKAVAAGAQGIDVSGEKWAQGTLSITQQNALKAKNVKATQGQMVAQNLAGDIATDATQGLFNQVGDVLGKQQNAAIFAPNEHVAAGLQATFGAMGYGPEGDKSLLGVFASKQRDNGGGSQTLGSLAKGTALNQVRATGLSEEIIGDKDYVMSVAGVSSRSSDSKMDPYGLPDDAAARRGLGELFDTRQREAIEQGKNLRLRIGGESGLDLTAGELAKERGIPLDVMLPMPPQEFTDSSYMKEGDKGRLSSLMSYADNVFSASSSTARQEGEVTSDLHQVRGGRDAMLMANQGRMANEVISYWDGQRGQTGSALSQASTMGIPITNLRDGGPTEAPTMREDVLQKNLVSAVNPSRVRNPSLSSMSGTAAELAEQRMIQVEQRTPRSTESAYFDAEGLDRTASPPVVNTTKDDPMATFIRKAASMVPDVQKLAPGGVHLVSQEEAQAEATRRYGENAPAMKGWNDPATGSAFIAHQGDSVEARASMADTTLHEIGHLAVSQAMDKKTGPEAFQKVRETLFGGIREQLRDSSIPVADRKNLLQQTVGRMSSAYRSENDLTHEFLARSFAQANGSREFDGDSRLYMQPNPAHRAMSLNEQGARAAFGFFNQIGRFASKWSPIWKGEKTEQSPPSIAGIPSANEPARFLARSAQDLVQHVESLSPVEAQERKAMVEAGRPALASEYADQSDKLNAHLMANQSGASDLDDFGYNDAPSYSDAQRPTSDFYGYDPEQDVFGAQSQQITWPKAPAEDPPSAEELAMMDLPVVGGNYQPDPKRMVMSSDTFSSFIKTANATQRVTSFSGEAFGVEDDSSTLNVTAFSARKQPGYEGIDRDRHDKSFAMFGISQSDMDYAISGEISQSLPNDQYANLGVGVQYDPKNQKLMAMYGDRELDWQVKHGDKLVPAQQMLEQLQSAPIEGAGSQHVRANRSKAKGNEWAEVADRLSDPKNATPEQLAIINQAKPGARMVIDADAGTGKTHTLMGSMASILRQGVLPEQMSMLTFTNKGVDEFRKKIDKTFGPKLGMRLRQNMNIRTTGGLANEIVRGSDSQAMASILRTPGFENDAFKVTQSSAYQRAYGRQEVEGDKGWHPGDDVMGMWDTVKSQYDTLSKNSPNELQAIQTAASKAYRYGKFQHELPSVKTARWLLDKSNEMLRGGQFGHEYMEQVAADPNVSSVDRTVGSLVKSFQQKQFSQGMLGQEEMKLASLRALQNPANDRFVGKLQEQFKQTFTDETQDLSAVEGETIERLSAGRGLIAAGDEKQGIYGWRGAMSQLGGLFSGIQQKLPLQQSWRSQQRILDTANAIHGTNTSLPDPRKQSGQGGEVTYSYVPSERKNKGDKGWERENALIGESLIQDLQDNPEFLKRVQNKELDQAMVLLPNHDRIKHFQENFGPRLDQMGVKLRVQKSEDELKQQALKDSGFDQEPAPDTEEYRHFSNNFQRVKDEYAAQQGVDLGTPFSAKGGEAERVYLGGATGEGPGQIITSAISKALGSITNPKEAIRAIADPTMRRDAQERENLLYTGITRAKSVLRMFGSGLRESRFTAAAARMLRLPTRQGAAAAASIEAGSDTFMPQHAPTRQDMPDRLPMEAMNAPALPGEMGPPEDPSTMASYVPPVDPRKHAFLDTLPPEQRAGTIIRVQQDVKNAQANKTGRTVQNIQGEGAQEYYQHVAAAQGAQVGFETVKGKNYVTNQGAAEVSLPPAQGPGKAAPVSIENVSEVAKAIGNEAGAATVKGLAEQLRTLTHGTEGDVRSMVSGMNAGQLTQLAKGVGSIENMGPSMQGSLSAHLPILVQSATAQGAFMPVAQGLSGAGYDATKGEGGAFRDNPFGRSNAGGGGGGGPRGDFGAVTGGDDDGGKAYRKQLQATLHGIRQVSGIVETFGRDAQRIFEPSIKSSSDYAFTTARAATATGRSQDQVSQEARELYAASPGSSLMDAAAVQRYIPDKDQAQQILRFGKVTGMGAPQAAQTTREIATAYGDMTPGQVANIATAVRDNGSYLDEKDLLHGAQLVASYGVQLDKQGKPIKGPERMAQAMAITDILGESGVNIDQGTRHLFQQMSNPDVTLANIMRKAQYNKALDANPQLTEKEFNKTFTNEAYWGWQQQQVNLLTQQDQNPQQLMIQRVQSGLNEQGNSGVPTGIGAKAYQQAVMGSSLSNLSSGEVDYRMQTDNLRFERENLGRQSRILDVQQRMQDRGIQMERLNIGMTGMQIRQGQEQLAVNREQFTLTKQQNQLDLRTNTLDLASMKVRAQYAPEQADLEYKQATIGFKSQIRDLNLEKRTLPLRKEQMDLNMESQKLNFEWQKEGIQFQRWYDEQMHGTIGSDRSYRASLAMQQGSADQARQGGAGSTAQSSVVNTTTQQVAKTPVMGLENEQFYAGITHQLSQLQFGRTSFRSEAAYSENVDYIKKQTEMYERRMAIEDKAREFSYRMQDKQLAMAEKQYELQLRMLEIEKEKLDNEIADKEALIPILQRLAEIDFAQKSVDIKQLPERVQIEEEKLRLKAEGIPLSEKATQLSLDQEAERLKAQGASLALQKANLADQEEMNKLQQAQAKAELAHRGEQLKFQEEMNRRQGAILEAQKKIEESTYKRAQQEAEILDYIIHSRQTFMSQGGGTENGRTMSVYDMAVNVNRGVQRYQENPNDPAAVNPQQLSQLTSNWENPALRAVLEAARTGHLQDASAADIQAAKDTMAMSPGDKTQLDALSKSMDAIGAFDADKLKSVQEENYINIGKMASTTLDATLALEKFKGVLGTIAAPALGPLGSTTDIANTVGNVAQVGTAAMMLSKTGMIPQAVGTSIASAGVAGVAALPVALAAGAGMYIGREGAKDLGIAERDLGDAFGNFMNMDAGERTNTIGSVIKSPISALAGMVDYTSAKWGSYLFGGKSAEESENAGRAAYQRTFGDMQNGDMLGNLKYLTPGKWGEELGKMGQTMWDSFTKGDGEKTVFGGGGMAGAVSGGLADLSKDVVELSKKAGSWIASIGTGFDDNIKKAQEAGKEISAKAGAFFGGLSSWWDDQGKSAGKTLHGIEAKTNSFFSGLGKWWTEQQTDAGKATKNVGKSVTLFFGGVGKWWDEQHTDFTKTTKTINKAVVLFFSDVGKWWEDRHTDFNKTTKDITKKVAEFFGGIGLWFETTAKEMGKLLKENPFAKIGEKLSLLMKPFDQFFSALDRMFKGLAEKLNPILEMFHLEKINYKTPKAESTGGAASAGRGAVGRDSASEDAHGRAGRAIGDRLIMQDKIFKLHKGEAVLTVPEAAAFKAGLEAASTPSIEMRRMANGLSESKMYNDTLTAPQTPTVVQQDLPANSGNVGRSETIQHEYNVSISQTLNGGVSKEMAEQLKRDTLQVVIDALKTAEKR